MASQPLPERMTFLPSVPPLRATGKYWLFCSWPEANVWTVRANPTYSGEFPSLLAKRCCQGVDSQGRENIWGILGWNSD